MEDRKEASANFGLKAAADYRRSADPGSPKDNFMKVVEAADKAAWSAIEDFEQARAETIRRAHEIVIWR